MKENKLPLTLPREGESQTNLFKNKEVRKVFHEKEWWFSVKDVLEALTDTTDGNRYSRDLREKDSGLKKGWAEITLTLPFTSNGGVHNTTFTNIEGVFRLMQSVPSSKAEPFKRWLAKVGFERLQEIQNPELAVKRAITLYRVKGYNDEWIEARIRNKASQELLTGEWQRRNMTTYIGLLTDAISVGTFGIKTADHKNLKKLKAQQSLRDNMSPIELTLTTLGEQATHEIIKTTNPVDLRNHIDVANQGGRIAGSARLSIERATGKKVVSPDNYLTLKQRETNTENDKEFNQIIKKLLGKPNSEKENNKQ